jgi:hypothetical protein
MIRIERGAELDGPSPRSGKRHGVFQYSCPEYPAECGFSRQPMLDACRQLKRILGPTASRAGVFREGRDTPDLSCQIEIGAATTVKEPFNSKITFGKYVDLTTVAFNREAAE